MAKTMTKTVSKTRPDQMKSNWVLTISFKSMDSVWDILFTLSDAENVANDNSTWL